MGDIEKNMAKLNADLKVCILCEEPFTGYGHNPAPLEPYGAGRCCDACNMTRVIPARLSMMGVGG